MCARTSPGTRKRTGFTLIELLVVIAIIAIVAAIMFPVFTKARASSLLSRCMVHIREAGQAVLMYVDDNNGRFPSCVCTWNGQSDFVNRPMGQFVGGTDTKYASRANVVAPASARPTWTYMRKSRDIWRCPAEKKFPNAGGLDAKDYDYWGNSYPMNAEFYGPGFVPWIGCLVERTATGFQGRKMSEITRSSKVILLGERGIHQYFVGGTAEAWTIDTDGTGRFRNHDANIQRTPVVFTDGHVRYITVTPNHSYSKGGSNYQTYGLYDENEHWILVEQGWVPGAPQFGAPPFI